MAKNTCNKEFNPWPSFVDLFSSVILVLIFFILVIVTLLAYFMQFKYKKTDANKIVVETKKVGQPIEGKQSKINLIPKPAIPSKNKMKDMKIGLEISDAKDNIKPKKKTKIPDDYLLIFFKKKSVVIPQSDYENIKTFLNNKQGNVEIELSIPNISNRKILNNKKAMLRGISINSYLTKMVKSSTILTGTHFELTPKIHLKETLTDNQKKYGYVKIYVKGN
jgi:hypothetical protein